MDAQPSPLSLRAPSAPHSPQPTAHSPQPTSHTPQPTAHTPQPTAPPRESPLEPPNFLFYFLVKKKKKEKTPTACLGWGGTARGFLGIPHRETRSLLNKKGGHQEQGS